MINKFCLFIFSILVCCSGHLLGQNYAIDVNQFGIDEGLLHREVGTVFEDENGSIWIGMNTGLQRFDGQDFKTWTKEDRTHKIYEITAIGQDQAGWLWLWNNNRFEFVFLNPVSEEILTVEERFGENFPIKRLSEYKGWHNSLEQLPVDSKGRLYFTSSQPSELIIFDVEKGFEIIPLPFISSDFLKLSFIDSEDNLWITESQSNSKLHKITPFGEILNSFDYPNSFNISKFSQKEEYLYFKVTYEEKIEYYKVENKREANLWKEYGRIPNDRLTIHTHIWEYTSKGRNVFGKDIKDTLFSLPKDQYPKVITDEHSNIYEDSKGRNWFYGGWGLGLLVARPSPFKQYFSFEKGVVPPINNSARGILVDKDTIYTNFEFGGLVRFPKGHADNWSLIKTGKTEEIYYGRPITLAEEEGYYIGLGYKDFHLQHVIPEKNKVNRISPLENTSISSHIWSFYRDQNKYLWIGISEGLAYKKPGSTVLQTISPKDSLLSSKNGIYHISPAADEKLWLCGSEHLYLFDPKSKTVIERFGSEEPTANYLPANIFYYLHTDADGVHWLGTDEGLIRWDRSKQETKLFTRIHGLSNNVIYAVLEDDHNHLWLSSDYGIMQFNKETFHTNTYLEKDGISFYEFNRTSSFQEKDGTIYFGGLNGVTAFHPNDFYGSESEVAYKMLITGFELFDGSLAKLLDKTGEIRSSKHIIIRPNDRFFRLKFTLPVMEDIHRITYAWRVEGLDEDWNYQKENSLQIGQLPYGEYTLLVKGQSSGGQWSPHQLAIRISVLAPFYLQSWFLLVAFLSLIAGIYFIYSWRTRQYKVTQQILETEIEKATTQIQQDKKMIEQQSEELQALDKMKSRFFANVSHELRTPLTLITSPISSVLKRGQMDHRDLSLLQKAQQSSKDLLKLIGSILDLSKMESGKMQLNLEPIVLLPLIRRLISAFESHAQHSGIELSFVYQAEKDLQIEMDKDKLEMIINNLLSNAIKFTPRNGKVAFSIEDTAQAIEIKVRDTGRGISANDLPHIFDRFYQTKTINAPAEGGTGIGLALTQELVKVLEGKIWVESEMEKGTTFFVNLPKKEILGTVFQNLEESVKDQNREQEQKTIMEEQEKIVEAIPTASTASSTILIVEDNHSLRDYLQTILSSNYQVVTAENGKEALAILNGVGEEAIQLILSDIMMPVMDGYQFLEQIKSKDQFRHLPTMMLTARADIGDKLKALRIGVDDYLLKPFEEEELLVRIENLLSNYESRSTFWQTSKTEKHKKEEKIKILISEEDQLWLQNFEVQLKKQLIQSDYSVSQMAMESAMSESTLSRQLKRLTGLSPFRYLQEIRLNEARQLLENRRYNTIAQVAYQVGFSDANAFSRAFKKRFGNSPSTLILS